MKFIYSFLLILAGLMISCSDDLDNHGPNNPEEGEKEVTFSMTLPGMNIPETQTRAMGAKEEEVVEIDVLAFNSSDNFLYKRRGTVISQSANVVTIKSWLKIGSNQNLVIVANANARVNAASVTVGQAKSSFLANLSYSLSAGDKWAADGSGTYTPIPMYGETGPINIAPAGTPILVSLIRMLARIDVVVEKEAEDFELEEAYLYNYNTAGYISPSWLATPSIPNLPTAPGTQIGSKLSYAVPAYVPSMGTSFAQEMYTFETAAATDDTSLAYKNSVCLILKGKYKGGTDYYRVDFTYDGSTANTKGDYMPLTRNHKYEVKILSADGPGYLTESEALSSYTVQSNLKTRTIQYNEGDMKDINFNGQYMLAFNDDSFIVPATGATNTLLVTTDNPEGWKITGFKDESGADITWLDTDVKQAPTNDNKATTVTLTVESYAGSDPARVGYIEFSAGRLRSKIEIIQTKFKVEEPSNSYIVPPGTNNFLIPVLRAEQGIPGSLKRRTDFAEVFIWTDNAAGMSNSGAIQSIKAYGKSRKAVLSVNTGSSEGNAVVAVKEDGGDIKWSWHIWTTNFDPNTLFPASGTFMDRNLGALSNNGDNMSNWWNSIGMYYQWGRKDAFPQMYDKTTVLVGNNIINAVRKESYRADGVKQYSPFGPIKTLSESVKNPYVFSEDNLSSSTTIPYWLGSNGLKSWDDEGKTIFDPCPIGWRVPKMTEYDTITGDFTANTTAWRNKDAAGNVTPITPFYNDLSSNLNSGRSTTNINNGGFYPGAGGTFYGSNSLVIVLNDIAYVGYYWTAEPLSTTNTTFAQTFKITESNIKDYPTTSYRTRGFQIRCVRE